MLAAAHNVVCLLEARGTLPFLQRWVRQWLTSHTIFFSTNSVGEAKAGIIILVQKHFLASYEILPLFCDIIGGRACSLLLSSPKGPLVYLLAVHSERFAERMIFAVASERKRLGVLVAAARPRAGLGILFGDFNFVGREGTRWQQLPGRAYSYPTQAK